MSKENEIADVLNEIDFRFIRALGEPVRIEILKYLAIHGESDVKSLADKLPQDRSVISRHLALMEQAGLVQVRKEGRHMIYSVDGEKALIKSEQVADIIRRCLQIDCC